MKVYSDGYVATISISDIVDGVEDEVFFLDNITINGITYQQWSIGTNDNIENVLVFLNTNKYSNKVLLDHLEKIDIKLV